LACLPWFQLPSKRPTTICCWDCLRVADRTL